MRTCARSRHDKRRRAPARGADDSGRFVIGAPDLAWLYFPPEGGADVLLRSAVERDAVREPDAHRLSSYPGGL